MLGKPKVTLRQGIKRANSVWVGCLSPVDNKIFKDGIYVQVTKVALNRALKGKDLSKIRFCSVNRASYYEILNELYIDISLRTNQTKNPSSLSDKIVKFPTKFSKD